MFRFAGLLIFTLVTTISVNGCVGTAIVAGGAVAGAAAVDRRDTSTIINDNNIEINIKEAIYTDETIRRDIHVNVTSYNGVVLLSGETPTLEMRDKVVRHTQQVDTIKMIYNETIVAPPSEHTSRRQDTYVTSKVKTALFSAKEITGLEIKVVTENQVVYLMGLVTKEEGDIAANAARQVSEVKQIVKLFEYTQPTS